MTSKVILATLRPATKLLEFGAVINRKRAKYKTGLKRRQI
jgi:hypothetical protein